MSTLFVVATPIGNLSDLSRRAEEVLRSVPLVAAEDTRVTRKLLNHIGSKARSISFHEHSDDRKLRSVISALEQGDLALVTDAGTPGISDPGARLVAAAAEAGHLVQPVAGPSAIAAALSVSGFNSDRYQFLGFLPRQSPRRREALAGATAFSGPTVIYESPHRVLKTLADIASTFTDRPIVVCRELTKLHEETFRGTAAEAERYFERPRGEFVIVLAPADGDEGGVDLETVIAEAIARQQKAGLSGRTLVNAVVEETGFPRSRVYAATIRPAR